jgi:hypothetical protein
MVKLFLCLINYALRHENVRGSGDMAQPLLISAVDSERSASRPGHFTLRERVSGTHCLDVVYKRKISCHRRDRNPAVQPLALRYTDWVIPAHAGINENTRNNKHRQNTTPSNLISNSKNNGSINFDFNSNHNLTHKGKSKAISVTGRAGPYGCERSRLQHFLDNRLTEGNEVVSLTRRPPFTPRNLPGTHFCSRLSRPVDHRAIVRLEGLGKLKKSNEPIRNRTRDLPDFSIVPQPTTLSRAP